MSLKIEQICRKGQSKPKSRKWMKNQRNRKIRRTAKDEIPAIKYRGWDD